MKGSSPDVAIRRSYRRVQSSNLFNPTKHDDASLAEMDDGSNSNISKKFVLVEASRLTELSKLETILREEQNLIGEQCAWLMSDMQVKSHIPVPATRLAVHNLCETEMRRIFRDISKLTSAWLQYSRQHHYHKPHLFEKHSYLDNAPLAQRAMKLKLTREAAEAFRLKKDRDTMLFEDDLSYLSNAYITAQIRRRDYDRYYVLATRYGPYSESEFNSDSRPGKRYWVRATTGALRFQRLWDRYWAVTKLRRHRAARAIQTRWRGYITYKKLHPIVLLRMKFGKNSFMMHYWAKWGRHVRGMRAVRNFYRQSIEGGRKKCFLAWKQWTKETKERKVFVMDRFIRRMKNTGVTMTFLAWANWAKHQIKVKIKLRRRLQNPQFLRWVEFTEESKYFKKISRAATRIQSILRCFKWKKQFLIKKRCAAHLTSFSLIVLARRLASIRRNHAVMTEFVPWEPEELKRRFARLNENEKRRLLNQQMRVQDRETKDAAEMRKHLQTSNGKTQLSELVADIRDGLVVCAIPLDRSLPKYRAVVAQAQMELMKRCKNFARVQERHDYNTKATPFIRCADPRCHAYFVNEEQYHTHMQASELHKGEPPQYSVMHCQMRHSRGLECLRTFFLRRYGLNSSVNCLEAWIAISEWRKYMVKTDQFTSKAVAIYENFLRSDSARFIGFEFEGLDAVREQLERVKNRSVNGCMQPSNAALSRLRRVLGIPGQAFQKWTTDAVVMADIFDEVEWQCFLVVFKTFSADVTWVGSEEYKTFVLVTEQEAVIRRTNLINDYKQLRLKQFLQWGVDFKRYETAMRERALEVVEIIEETKINVLLERCMRICVEEVVFDIQYEEQKVHEERRAIIDDALDWSTMIATEEVYEVYVSALIDTMWAIPELRKGMLEYSGLLKKKNKKKLLIDMNVSGGAASKEWFENFMKDAIETDKKNLPPDADAAATRIQKIIRGFLGRRKARRVFVTVYVKRCVQCLDLPRFLLKYILHNITKFLTMLVLKQVRLFGRSLLLYEHTNGRVVLGPSSAHVTTVSACSMVNSIYSTMRTKCYFHFHE